MESVRIGAGAAYAGDRIEPAVELARDADLDYLVFECLAERTIALAEYRQRGGGVGYNELLEERIERVIPHCIEHDVTVITNMGAADPAGATAAARAVVDDCDASLTVASVTGSDVTDGFDAFDDETFGDEAVADYRDRAVGAHAYLGVDGVVEALERGADIVIGGRIADPSLFLSAMVHEFGWSPSALESPVAVGQGIAIGHLLECAGQLTGGYFADPGRKEVPDLGRLGFPYATVAREGSASVHSLPETGGRVTEATCTEQLLYETADPARYVTPDAVADFGGVTLEPVDRAVDGEPVAGIAVSGATAAPRTETLKVNVSYDDGWIGVGELSYAGQNALERAELAADVVRTRLDTVGVDPRELRVDYVGVDALHGTTGRERADDPYEVRLRVAGKCDAESDARAVAREVERLYTNGPAGGGGASMDVRRNVGIVSTLLARSAVEPAVSVDE
ncbi:acyclic terpene utilization AtuA family protein [Haloplanus pelagicus]|jgi:hypothetical protein|uniref:acyclic terpene utilization AtuA family protein n=1 Tax=Haloplanus pelagicus TaxID=2949995 RepID=UPI00203E3C97|nr:acyclic terpene utilization AtuA family protein [Haloplanus sp. HW8-1]